MTTDNDEIPQMCVDYAAKCEKPVLDGGAAYDVATNAALKKNATVIANGSGINICITLPNVAN